jgi:hypothetical protein
MAPEVGDLNHSIIHWRKKENTQLDLKQKIDLEDEEAIEMELLWKREDD